VAKPEIVQTDPPKKSGNKAKPDPSKFTITLSRFTRMWEPPREFSDGIPANSDLPEFFFFIGEEQKAAPDQLTNYSDINYEELDEEYIEDSFNVGIEIGTGPDPTLTKLDLSAPVPVYEEGGGSYESGAPAVLGGDADYWSLIACCLLEDANHPAEVAQCIYNRYGCPRRPYGQTIKGIVIAKNQFEVAFNKNPRTGDPSPAWKAISSRDTAIKAVQYSKGGGDYDDIGTKLDKIEKLLKNSDLQSKALALVGGRTGFRSSNSAMNSQKVSVKQTPAVGTGRNRISAGNKFFWERGTSGYNHYYLEQTDRATGRKYYNNPAGVPNMMKNSA
jgi:hypothetical protein